MAHHHHLLPYIHSHSHHHNNPSVDVPKGCVAVRVGKEGTNVEEEPQRFVVPVEYLNHPLFSRLLKVAEDEYGFDQKGTFTLPCRVAEFQSVQGLINQDIHNHHHHHHQHFRTNITGSSAGAHHHHPLHLAGCFKA